MPLIYKQAKHLTEELSQTGASLELETRTRTHEMVSCATRYSIGRLGPKISMPNCLFIILTCSSLLI